MCVCSPCSAATESRRRKRIKHVGVWSSVFQISSLNISLISFFPPGITLFFLISTFVLLKMWMCRSGGCVEQSCYHCCAILLHTVTSYWYFVALFFTSTPFGFFFFLLICWTANWPSSELLFVKSRILLLSNLLKPSVSVCVGGNSGSELKGF